MIHWTLDRIGYLPDITFGRILLPDDTLVYTVEPPWRENLTNVSCIPEGSYICRPGYFNGGGYPAVDILNVPGRSGVKFHIGNWVRNTQGCPLVVTKHDSVFDSKRGRAYMGGSGSAAAFTRFMRHFGKESSFLTIRNTGSHGR